MLLIEITRTGLFPYFVKSAQTVSQLCLMGMKLPEAASLNNKTAVWEAWRFTLPASTTGKQSRKREEHSSHHAGRWGRESQQELSWWCSDRTSSTGCPCSSQLHSPHALSWPHSGCTGLSPAAVLQPSQRPFSPLSPNRLEQQYWERGQEMQPRGNTCTETKGFFSKKIHLFGLWARRNFLQPFHWLLPVPASHRVPVWLLPAVTASTHITVASRNGELPLSMGQMPWMWSVYWEMVQGAPAWDTEYTQLQYK